MDELRNRIIILKQDIINKIDIIGHSELGYVKDFLIDELNSYQYNEKNENSLKVYYAWLLSFYENKIKLVINKINSKNNTSVFDNSSEEQANKISDLKKNIESLLNYFNSNYPSFGKSISEKYESINAFYENEFNNVLNSSKMSFDIGNNFLVDPDYRLIDGLNTEREVPVPKYPILSLYSDVHSLRKAHINELDNFIVACEGIKTFAEKDMEIRKVFEKAYNIFKDDNIINMIKDMERKYDAGAHACIEDILSVRSADQVQESAKKLCEQIELMIEKEKTRNNYYQRIIDMTLNTDVDTIIELCNYVETNHLFEEEFYHNLYLIIEKEKYLVSVLKDEPQIYPFLTPKAMTILEKMFISKLDNLSKEEISEITEKLLKYGYYNVLDKEYFDFFNSQKYRNELDFDMQEKNYCVKKKFERQGLSILIDIIITISNRKNFHINYYGKHLSDTNYTFKRGSFECLDDNYIFVRSSLYPNQRVVVDCKNRKLYKIPDKLFGYVDILFGDVALICQNDDDEPIEKIVIYNDKKIKKIEIEPFSYYFEDKKKRLLLTSSSLNSEINIYDSSFSLVDSIAFDGPIEILSANDGIAVLSIKGRVFYYDYINKREIETIEVNSDYNLYKLLGYSEGLYTFIDSKTGLMGYKDIDGNIVFEPRFKKAGLFVDNVAKVSIEVEKKEKGKDLVDGIIDRAGNFISMKKVSSMIYNNRKAYYEDKYGCKDTRLSYSDDLTVSPNLSCNRQNVIQDFYEYCAGYLIVRNNYQIDIDAPIRNINFESKERIYCKK